MCSITTGSLDANAAVLNGEYAFFTCDKVPKQIDKYAFDGDAILVSGNGSQVGHISAYNGKFNAYQRTYVLMDFTIVSSFAKILLEKALPTKIESECFGGAIPYIKLDTLKKLKVMLP